MAYFAEDLLASIKLRSLAPISQSTFDDSKLLNLANEEMQLNIVSELIKVREDFFLAEETQNLIGNVSNYNIPSRSIGTALKDVFYVDNGTTKRTPLVRVDVERSQYYQTPSNRPSKFYFLGDEIVLLPTPSAATGSLKMVFPAMPSTIVLTPTCAKIVSVSQAGTTASYIVNTDLTASLKVGDNVDFLSTSSPFKLWTYKTPILQITSTQIDVALSAVTNEAGNIEPLKNDFICPTGTANIPMLPIAYQPVLAQAVVVRLMESLGDLNKLQAAKGTLAEMKAEAASLTKNRVENEVKRVTGRNQLKNFFR